MITVHIILNAHLDPVWLWSWRDGLDEVLNSSYYTAGILDRHPEVTYTRGEAWVYEQICRLDPELFQRIRDHIKAGRWNTVGGWYIQPDCNLPSGFALERQIAIGKRFFLDHFGEFPQVAYNVDSFGHAATLPGYMQQAGQHSYVMMRPPPEDLALPARLFRWRGYVDGPEVTVFRIAEAYCTPEGMSDEHLRACLTDLPAGVKHTMCFAGIGDHGGGPTESIIEWFKTHRTSFDGVKLEFSTPARFFAAVAAETAPLPLFVGELQHHAIGCYSVHRPVKVAVRRAEHLLIQAEIARGEASDTKGGKTPELARAWQKVCFHHFHDTLGGTCLPSAYREVEAELGMAAAAAEETAALSVRERFARLDPDSAQRLALFNASDRPFDDFVEIEPWLEWTPWQRTWKLVDEKGADVPYQEMASESAGNGQTRLLIPIQLGPSESRILRIVAPRATPVAEAHESPVFNSTPTSLQAVRGYAINLGPQPFIAFPGAGSFSLPQLIACDDPSDTWSHGLSRYERKNPEAANWSEPIPEDRGLLMESLFQSGSIGRSEVQAEWRLYRDQPWVECRLRVVWAEKHRVLKLEWDLPSQIVRRTDGIMGGCLERAADGRELPMRDWTRLTMQAGPDAATVAIVAPDVFALDCTTSRVSLTLLRSSVMACHDPNPGTHPRRVISDRGEHQFRFRFLAGNLDSAYLDDIAMAWQRPLLSCEITRGMKTRAQRGAYALIL